MKKLLVLILAVLFCVSLAGCGDSEAEMDEPQIVGGWQKAEDETVTDEYKAMFEKALEGYTGASFTPVKLIATQVVAGINYKFLCEQTIIAATPIKSEKYVTIYCDLEGNCSITNVEDVSD